MTTRSLKISADISSLALVVSLVACSGPPDEAPTPAPSPPSTPSTPPEIQSADNPSPPGPLPSASPVPPKSSPAATTSGPLSGDTMPKKLLAFLPVAGKASEGEYQPNGTFVHALDPKLSVRDALPQCGETVQVPEAEHALGASYQDGKGRLGNGIAFQFASDAEASLWFTSFTGLIKQCKIEGMKPVITEATLQDQRFSGEEIWTEAGVVEGNRVTMVIVEGRDHDAEKLLTDLLK